MFVCIVVVAAGPRPPVRDILLRGKRHVPPHSLTAHMDAALGLHGGGRWSPIEYTACTP